MRLPGLWLFLTWLLLAGLFLLLIANMKEEIPSAVSDKLTNNSEYEKLELKYLDSESLIPSFTERKLSDPLDDSVLNFEEDDTISVDEIYVDTDRDTENLTTPTTNIPSGKVDKNLKSGVEHYISVQKEQFSVIKVNSDSKRGTLTKDKPSIADDGSPLSSKDTDMIVAEEKLIAMNIDNYWQQLYASPDILNVTEVERLIFSVENYISDEAEQPDAIRLGHDPEHRIVTRDIKSEKMQEDGRDGRRTAGDISSAAMKHASHEIVSSMEDEILSPMEYFNDQEHRVLKKDDPSNAGDKGTSSPTDIEVVVLNDNLSAMNIDNYWQQFYASPKKLNVKELERLKYSVENYNSVLAEQAGSRSLAHDSEHRIVRWMNAA